MAVLPLQDAQTEGFHLRFLEAIRMPQRVAAPAFSSIGYPKRQDMILYVDGCSTEYLTKDGRRLRTEDGDIVYVPRGAEYRVCCVEESERSATLQINFLLFREVSSEPFVFSEDVVIYKNGTKRLRDWFERAILHSMSASVSPNVQKTVLYELLQGLSSEHAVQDGGVIQRGIEYLQTHYHEDPTVFMLARLSHVSEEYFRRLFRRQMGTSPIAYKNELRQKKAAQYLMYTDMSIGEISESLSYATLSHFIKAFKERYGCSPLVFRHAYRSGELLDAGAADV